MVKPLRIVIMTMGIAEIVVPLLESGYEVSGIIECAPRKEWKKNFCRKARSFFKKGLKDLSVSKKVPYYYARNGNDKALEDRLRSLKPDLMVVFSAPFLLKKNIFDIPAFGTINLHPSFLPKYRGPNPWFWMYYDMDLSPGVTIHYIDEGEDTGDIICQDRFDIPVGIKYADFREKALKETGLDLLFRAIDGIADGNPERTPQPEESPTMKARNVRSEEIRNIIDWQSWDVERVWHMLRGTEGWLDILKHPPGFYWTINEYKRCDMKNYEISRIYREEGSCFLACRGGKILLKLKFSLFKHGAKNG